MRVPRLSGELSSLAVPLVLTQLAQVALTTTDTVMMGLLGTRTLAAGGLAIVIFNQLRTMGVGLLTAVGNQIATAHARGERAGSQADEEVRRIVRASFVVATAAGVLGAAVMIGIGQALTLLGQDGAVASLTQRMLWALAPGLVPCLWFQVVRQLTVGMRRPQALLRITIVSVAVNAGLNYLFIHGTWVFPKLGLTGIGLSTSLVYLGTFVALAVSVRRDPVLGALLAGRGAAVGGAGRAAAVRVVRSGVPIAATYASEAGFFSVTALVVGSFGAAALAAHTAVNQLVYVVFQVAVGLSHASSILVSRQTELHGLGSARLVRDTALRAALAVMVVVGLVYVFLPNPVLDAFLDNGSAHARSIATHLLLVAAVLQFFDCSQNIGIGLLRGLGDTTSSLRLSFVGYWFVGLPAVLLLSLAAGLGALGVWLGLLAGLAATSVLLLRTFQRKTASPALVTTPPRPRAAQP